MKSTRIAEIRSGGGPEVDTTEFLNERLLTQAIERVKKDRWTATDDVNTIVEAVERYEEQLDTIIDIMQNGYGNMLPGHILDNICAVLGVTIP